MNPTKNPLLADGELPAFSAIAADQVLPAIETVLAEYQSQVERLTADAGARAAVGAGYVYAICGDMRIVAVSASAYDRDRSECFRAGCDDFLAKPVKRDDLFTRLRVALGQCSRP